MDQGDSGDYRASKDPIVEFSSTLEELVEFLPFLSNVK